MLNEAFRTVKQFNFLARRNIPRTPMLKLILFEILVNSGIRFAISEFDNALVLELAEKYELHVTEIGERRNLKNRRTEILITNYEPIQKQPALFSWN